MASFLLTTSTDIRKDDLKRFIRKCLDNELEEETIIIGFDYNKDSAIEDIWGFAFQGVRTISIILPQRWKHTPKDVRGVAQVILHELGHTYGLDEHEIPPLNQLDTRWAKGLQLRRRKEGHK